VAWRHPIGTARKQGPFGIPSMIDVTIGVPNIGGSMTTASGLPFVAATVENYIRAFDTRTGKELWRASLPAGGQATPAVYVSPKSGREFLVIAAGGNSALGPDISDHVVAYALP
jgi:quinoprotein glucose dehydrogenase